MWCKNGTSGNKPRRLFALLGLVALALLIGYGFVGCATSASVPPTGELEVRGKVTDTVDKSTPNKVVTTHDFSMTKAGAKHEENMAEIEKDRQIGVAKANDPCACDGFWDCFWNQPPSCGRQAYATGGVVVATPNGPVSNGPGGTNYVAVAPRR